MRKTLIFLASLAFTSPAVAEPGSQLTMSSLADNLHPVSRVLRNESMTCRSDTKKSEVAFHNIGSMCADGFFALMEGRGCENTVGTKDPTGRWTVHTCETTATCDRLHNNSFAIVPVGISITDNFGENASIWCADSAYVIVKL